MARLKIGQKPALDDMAAGVVAQRWEEDGFRRVRLVGGKLG
jgi:hypothetical protein